MDILTFLYQLLIMPLQILFEEIYYFAFYITKSPGVAIIVFSFIVSLLLLPIYQRADVVQQNERSLEAKMSKGVEHIKKTFRGDEQLLMLQTYYRKNKYNPIYSLKSSLSLIIQIPFFIAAYQFLSGLEILSGASCGFIKDLSIPDALINLTGVSINVLPVIMTLVNLISTYFFTQGLPTKIKIQLNMMTLFFLVFLYNAPSGLVLYWTCNNVFNLVKSIIKKLENPSKGIYFVLGLCSLIVLVYGFYNALELQTKAIGRILLYALALNLPFIISKISNKFNFKFDVARKPNLKLFLAGAFFLAILVGGVVPSAVLSSSPQEFVVNDYLTNPAIYLLYSVTIACGTFVIWMGVFYWIASPTYKVLLEKIILCCCIIAITNYMCFGKELGLLTPDLEYEDGMSFSKFETYINVGVVLVAIMLSNFVFNIWKNKLVDALAIGTIAFIGMVSVNFIDIKKSIDTIDFSGVKHEEIGKVINLSKDGKNIIVLMLDRAIGLYVPYIFNEKPVLKEKFAGFTYYSNTVSFGANTNFTTPSLFGGYEYTPLEMNKRGQLSLKDKHNEALRVMPVLFNKRGFDVTVCDPVYENYGMISNGSIYADYPKIKKYNLIGKIDSRLQNMDRETLDRKTVEMNNRNFFVFGFMKCLPIAMQKTIYNYGQYNLIQKDSQVQSMTSLYTAKFTSKRFLRRFDVLRNLPDITQVNNEGNNFIMMVNSATHEPCLLQTPEYLPSAEVDNIEYEKKHSNRFVYNGRKIKMSTPRQIIHYHANMASLIQLGNWFDYMRECDVYDNTRIIVVADHGRALNQVEDFVLDDGSDYFADIQHYYPLFMVKDFGKTEFEISDEFMTNADVASIATNNVIDEARNPFTGKLINSSVKASGKQYILSSKHWDISVNNGNTFLPGKWYSVHTDMRDKNNWELVKENDILPY